MSSPDAAPRRRAECRSDKHQIQRHFLRVHRGCAGDCRLVCQVDPLMPDLRVSGRWSRPAVRHDSPDGRASRQPHRQRLANATRCSDHNNIHIAGERAEQDRLPTLHPTSPRLQRPKEAARHPADGAQVVDVPPASPVAPVTQKLHHRSSDQPSPSWRDLRKRCAASRH
jgi:hypothetical protein